MTGGSSTIKKFLTHLLSLKLAIFLFLFIALYSIIGTLIPQGLDAAFYQESYPSFSGLLLLLQMDHVYSSAVFGILVTLFVINLAGCTVKIFPSQKARMKGDYFPPPREDSENHFREDLDLDKLALSLAKNGYRVEKTEEGFRAGKHRMGAVGSSVTHLGIIVIIVGGFVGSLFATEGFFNLMPGDAKTFSEQEFQVQLDDFYLGFREDGSVSQYYSELTVTNQEGGKQQETIWVNKPLNYGGMNFYQSSYGWASRFSILDEAGEILHTGWLRNGESYFYQPEHLTVYLYGYFPDLVVSSDGVPMSMTEKENNPFYALILYHFNQRTDSYLLEPGQTVPHGNLTIRFEESKLYTGITYRSDFGYYFILLGSLIILIGMALSFYFYPKFVYADASAKAVRASARQNLWGLNAELRRYIKAVRS